MLSNLLEPHNAPFGIALGVMLLIALTELLGALIGLAPSGLVDSLLPDLPDAPDVDAGLAADAGPLDGDPLATPHAVPPGPLSQVLSWLCFGRVPALILLVVFLATFGLIGLLLQGALHGLVGFYLPGLVAAAAAFAPGSSCRWGWSLVSGI